MIEDIIAQHIADNSDYAFGTDLFIGHGPNVSGEVCIVSSLSPTPKTKATKDLRAAHVQVLFEDVAPEQGRLTAEQLTELILSMRGPYSTPEFMAAEYEISIYNVQAINFPCLFKDNNGKNCVSVNFSVNYRLSKK